MTYNAETANGNKRQDKTPLLEQRLSVAQLAAMWGCSRQHVYNLVARNELAHVRVGNLLRFRLQDVHAYEEAKCPAPELTDPNTRLPREPMGRVLPGIMSSGGKTVEHAASLAAQHILRRRAATWQR